MPTLYQVYQHINAVQNLRPVETSRKLTRREALERDHEISIRLRLINEYTNKLQPYVAKGKYQMAKTTKTQHNDFGYDFVTVRLSDKHLKEFKTWAVENADNVAVFWEEILHEDYKITTKYSDKQDLIYVSVVGGKDHHLNSEKTLTSFAPDIVTAFLMSYYKVAVHFGWEVWKSSAEDRPEIG